jgi:hypothetical protein
VRLAIDRAAVTGPTFDRIRRLYPRVACTAAILTSSVLIAFCWKLFALTVRQRGKIRKFDRQRKSGWLPELRNT